MTYWIFKYNFSFIEGIIMTKSINLIYYNILEFGQIKIYVCHELDLDLIY